MIRSEVAEQRSTVHIRLLSLLAMAFALCALAIFVRGASFNVYYPINSYWDIRVTIVEAILRSYYDIATVLGVTLFASLALVLMRQTRTGQSVVVWIYYAFAALMGLLFCVNSRALEILGGPITYQWLYYADFLRSFTSRTAITSNLDSFMLMLFAVTSLALTVGFWSLKFLLNWIWSCRVFSVIVGFSFLLTVGYLGHPQVRAWVHGHNNERRLTNSLVELVSTALVGNTDILSKLPVSLDDADFRIGSNTGLAKSRLETTPRPRNVILVVMESVGANFVIGSQLIGESKTVDVTPHLTAARAAGITFNNFYANAPMSTKSLFSILVSRHPLFSHVTEISRIGNAPIATLASQLKGQGYRTAFFMSGDFRFQQVDRFLSGRGFDVLADMTAIPCSIPIFSSSKGAWTNLDNVDDECTTDALSNWIGGASGAPFFGMMWTGNTHWPYFSRGEQANFSADDRHLNRYLNALRSSDASIGKLLIYLDKKGIANDTLVVVIGDHGEAFGEHGARTHGDNVFEEEVHIPLLLINPSLFRGESDSTIGSLVDLAPTILDVLKIEAPPAWQGRSMFAIERSPRVYFMAPNLEMTAGYREGDFKFIFNLTRKENSVFDLKQDPGETRNVIHGMGDGVKVIQERLAAWVQYQERLFAQPTTPSP